MEKKIKVVGDAPEEKKKNTYQKRVHRFRILIALGIIATVVLAVLLYLILVRYTDYGTEARIERSDSAQTKYMEFEGNILAYSLDGVTYSDHDGNVIWNESYEMLHPTVRSCEGHIVIYDRQGTLVKSLSATGADTTIYTTMPVSEADISENGYIAVLMQQASTGFLQVYNASGQVSASGELHMASGGYPIDLALSSDGMRLAASIMDLVNGELRAKLIFYDFGKAGEDKDKRIVATITYANTVMPEIDFVNGDRLMCVCDNGIRIFSNAETPQVTTEVSFPGQMKSVIHNNRYFAVIGPRQDDEGRIDDVLRVYNLGGRILSEVIIDEPYQYFRLLENNEFVLSDGSNVSVYSIFGVKRFTYQFPDTLYEFLYGGRYREYTIIRVGEMERIRVR